MLCHNKQQHNIVLNMSGSKNPLQNFYQTNFHTAALWGAITFVRELCGDQNISIRTVIEEFRNYLGYDENNLPIDSAMMAYYRTNEKIRASIGKEDKTLPLFRSEVVSELQDIRNAINFHLDNTCSTACPEPKPSTLIPGDGDGYIFEYWFKFHSGTSLNQIAKRLGRRRSTAYQLFKTDQFKPQTWEMLKKIGYTKKIKINLINEQGQTNSKGTASGGK